MTITVKSIDLPHAVTEHQPFFGTDVTTGTNTRFAIICGNCGVASNYHPIHSEFLVCPRTEDSFPNFYLTNTLERSDYYQDTVTGAMFLPNDYSGYGDVTNEEPDNYESTDVELTKLDNWTDATYNPIAKTWVGTTTLAQHLTGVDEALVKVDGSVSPYSKDSEVTNDDTTVYVEGQEGFIARTFINDLLTRKYHARLLNVFSDKRTKDLRVGSIRIIKCVDHMIEARCVNGTCKSVMSINTDTAVRSEMEEFVLAIIRHGNNHAAEWFRSRNTFYKVHAPNCNLSQCDPNVPFCLHTNASRYQPSDDVQVLLDHNSNCKDSKCKCSDALTYAVPALAS